MTRVKRGVAAHKKHKKLLATTKGYKLGRKKLFRQAKQASIKAGVFSYRDRKVKKRKFRSLWIIRLNAAVRNRGLLYKDFIAGLKKANILLNRKVLSQLALENSQEFDKIVDKVKKEISQ